jgi:hypothetical protein
LKHQERGFTRIDSSAIEGETVRRSGERNVRLDVVKGRWIVAEVLSLEEDDGEVCCHGVDLPSSESASGWSASAARAS